MGGEPFTGLALARILRPWGRRGQAAAEILTDFPARLTTLREAWLCGHGKSPRAMRINSCRIHLGQAIFHFTGVDSIDDAERLRGYEVQVPISERVALPAGRHYISELIGCTVWEAPAADTMGETAANAGAPLGVVRDVQRVDDGARAVEAWVLAIDTAEGELLVPLASELCLQIDTSARCIVVRLPEGLRSLNSAS